MDNRDLIDINDFCKYNHVEITFVRSLADSGLVEMAVMEEGAYIPFEEMPRVEKFVRMHYDLDINLEGLETIDHLLNKMEAMQQEIRELKSRLGVG